MTQAATSLMDTITRAKTNRPRRTLIYGVAGIGKTTFASMSPDPIVIQTEDGCDDLDVPRFPVISTLDEFNAIIRELYSTKHEFKTLIVDSVDWLERIVQLDVCKRHGFASIEDPGYGKGYTYAADSWRGIIEALDALRNDRGMSIVLIAHAKVEKYNDPHNEPYDRYMPDLHKRVSSMIQEWCSEVLFANYKVFTKETDEGFNKKRTMGVGQGERVLFTTERPGHLAKNRLGLPDEIPLEYRVYSEHIATN